MSDSRKYKLVYEKDGTIKGTYNVQPSSTDTDLISVAVLNGEEQPKEAPYTFAINYGNNDIVVYRFEDGMTAKQWAESEYCTEEAEIVSSVLVITHNGTRYGVLGAHGDTMLWGASKIEVYEYQTTAGPQ